jgi:hypothetical protein
MATVAALAIRRAHAQQRLQDAADALSARLGLSDVGKMAGPSRANRDPEIGRLEQLERIADLLEAVLAASAPREARDPGEMTVADVEAFAATATKQELRALWKREQAGKNRAGVGKVLDARMGELQRAEKEAAEQTAVVIDEASGEQTATVIAVGDDAR